MARRLERFASASVLVVDDNAANVALLKAILQDEGLIRVTTETDSRRVAGLLPVVSPDLVLLDLHMPHVDGRALLGDIIRFAAGTYLPVLVLTADIGTAARDWALANGARDFLTKPFDNAEVVLRAANLLETRQLHVSLRRQEAPVDDPGGAEGPWDAVTERVQRVLRERSITPAYQRIAEVAGLTTVGYEALARFPECHARGPAGWFSDAFRVGLGVDLEWLAVGQALPLLRGAAASEFLAVNMSPATVLGIPHLGPFNADLCPRIVIELTEHVPIEDYSALHRALAEVRELGVRVAADDLGAGYAGFRHLIALEPDIIKLDISLVRGIPRSRGARALASALVAFARDMGATVIAEGVEDGVELAAVRDLGVPWAQGYHLDCRQPEPGRRPSRPGRAADAGAGRGGGRPMTDACATSGTTSSRRPQASQAARDRHALGGDRSRRSTLPARG